MSKHRGTSGPAGRSRLRSLLAFRHQNPVARLLSILAAFAIAALLVVGIGPAYAVHDNGMFELDGNIAHDSSTTPPYDWASLFNGSGATIATVDPENGPILATTFRTDTATPDASYFSSSNKDIDSIGSWSCGPANNPLDKDDLQHAYAALIHVPNGAPDNANHDVLYLGSDRLGNNGDAFAGFWLLKDPHVGCTSGSFSGHHTDGDLLIVSDYTNGGGTEHVKVYKWVGDDATGHAELDADYNPSQCSNSLSQDNACADANDSTINAPWRSGILTNEFVETGIDMTHLLNGAAGCFTTFLAETRTSQELTAELKDFAGGQFDTCPPAPIATTSSPTGSNVALGTSVHDTATLTAVGGRPVPTGTVKFFLCQPSEVTSGVGCDSGDGTQVGIAKTISGGSATSDSTSNTNVTGKYCWRAEYTPDNASAGYYVANSHTNDTTECFTVVKNSPTISTQINVTGTGLGFATLGDTATLHSFAGDVTGETVTFDLYGPADPNCTGTPVFSTTGDLNGSGVATTSATYKPTAAGTYTWIASYPGDALNTAVAGACSDSDESTTVSGTEISVTKTANPGGPVSAGDAIGFDITVTNNSSVAATDVVVTDNLPAKADGASSGDLDWSLDPSFTGCDITGAVGSEVLTCNLGQVNASSSVGPIHLTSATTAVDCGVVSNKATVATSNGAGGDSDTAHVTVQCPSITLAKTADSTSVTAGGQIGFTVTASNSGPGAAHDVVINDPLPAGNGINWSIASGPGNCSITGAPPTETLTCTAVDLAAGASESVHVVSATGNTSCAVYPNTASLTASNGSAPNASASITVAGCVVVSPPSPPQQHHPHVLPNTGGPQVWPFAAGLALLLGGGTLVLADQRRKRRS